MDLQTDTKILHIKLEGLKVRFPLTWLITWFRCIMARSYAVCTDLRTLGFLPSISRSLSTVSSIPIGSNLSRGSHCLKSSKKVQQNKYNRKETSLDQLYFPGPIKKCSRVRNVFFVDTIAGNQ